MNSCCFGKLPASRRSGRCLCASAGRAENSRIRSGRCACHRHTLSHMWLTSAAQLPLSLKLAGAWMVLKTLLPSCAVRKTRLRLRFILSSTLVSLSSPLKTCQTEAFPKTHWRSFNVTLTSFLPAWSAACYSSRVSVVRRGELHLNLPRRRNLTVSWNPTIFCLRVHPALWVQI